MDHLTELVKTWSVEDVGVNRVKLVAGHWEDFDLPCDEIITSMCAHAIGLFLIAHPEIKISEPELELVIPYDEEGTGPDGTYIAYVYFDISENPDHKA